MKRGQFLFSFFTMLAMAAVLFPSLVFAAGPAGVESGLKFWFSADSGAKDSGGNQASDSEQVETWEDQSADNRDATRSAGSAVYSQNGLNFNPTLDFSDGRYQASDTGLVSGAGDRSIFVVASADSGGWRYVLGAGTFSGSQGFDFGHNSNNGSVFITTHSSQSASTGSWTPYGTARLAYGAVDGGPLYIAVNGSTPVQGSGGNVNTALNGSVKIGSNSRGDEYWDGSISEVIYYDRLVTNIERQRINSYLALKYGFSLDQSTAQSYLASGSNLMWDKDASGASTYDNDLFGIGRDDASNLSQIKSRGQNQTTVITVEAIGEGTNLEPDFEDMDDLEFLVFGDNGGAASWTETGAPDGYSVLARQWKKQEQGNVGFVNMDFDVANSNMNIPAPLDGGIYYFVYDSDNDGSLSDEVPQGMSDQGSDDWRVAVDFGSGGLFTLATTENPAAESLSPVDNAVGVSATANLVIVLSATVTADTGNIVIKKSSDDSIVEAISVTSDQVTGGGTDTITINPSVDLSEGIEYYVQIPSTAFKDSGDNYFPGITNTTGWSFTTGGDGDGVSEATEDAAPNGGDGNDDGTDDSEQANVTSLVNTEADGDPYITLGVDNSTCSSLSSVSVTSAPADTGYTYPVGLLDFDAECTSGETATITVYYDQDYDTTDWVARKYINGAYSTIDGATFGTATIGASTVTTLTYEVEDGGPLDADGTVNGTIEDPVGPAIAIAVAQSTSDESKGSSSGGTYFGCKDKNASNYEYFSRHKQELCKYDAAPVQTGVCTPYITSYIRYGADNNLEDVRKLEIFLNEKQGENLVVDGVYGLQDVEAVKRFQQKYASAVLGVWGLSESTGYVYRTTLMKINSFYCSAALTCPAFTEYNSLTENSVSAEVAKTKTLLSELGFYSGVISNSFDAPLDASLKSFQQTFSETMLKPWGLSSGTGYKYKTTNKFLNMIVGCETPAVELDGKGVFDY